MWYGAKIHKEGYWAGKCYCCILDEHTKSPPINLLCVNAAILRKKEVGGLNTGKLLVLRKKKIRSKWKSIKFTIRKGIDWKLMRVPLEKTWQCSKSSFIKSSCFVSSKSWDFNFLSKTGQGIDNNNKKKNMRESKRTNSARNIRSEQKPWDQI